MIGISPWFAGEGVALGCVDKEAVLGDGLTLAVGC